MRKLLSNLCRAWVQPDPEETYRERLLAEIRKEKNYNLYQKKIMDEIAGAKSLVQLNAIKWSLRKIFRDNPDSIMPCLMAVQRKRKEILFKKTLKEVSEEYFKLTDEKID